MIQIDDKIISFEIFENKFSCDLNACKGACCVEGDAGAPLNKSEVNILKKLYSKIKPFMRKEGITEVNKQGVYVIDSDGDKTTPLVSNNECAFVYFNKGIAKCAIEKAYDSGKIDFKKPISCHLYPARVKKYRDFDAVNYEEIKLCNSACKLGEKLKTPVYIFLKDAFIRAFGKTWYTKLCDVALQLKNSRIRR